MHNASSLPSPTMGLPTILALLLCIVPGIFGNAYAACGECISGQYKYCDGDCAPEDTQQGECTTRYDATCNPQKWCCCANSYTPSGGGGQTTPGGPPGSIGECPTSDGDKPPSSTWAASAAVAKTPDPKLTDSILGLVRDNVLAKNPRGQKYVKMVYQFSDDVDRILSANPSLATETAVLLKENLSLLTKLAKGQEISVTSSRIGQALTLLDKYADAAGKNDALKSAITNAKDGLRDKPFLMKLGIRVQD